MITGILEKRIERLFKDYFAGHEPEHPRPIQRSESPIFRWSRIMQGSVAVPRRAVILSASSVIYNSLLSVLFKP